MTTLHYGPPLTPAAPGPTRWRWWQWLLLVVGALAAAVASGVATLVTVFAVGTTCGTPATVGTLREGQLWLLVVLVVAALPFGLPALLRPGARGRWLTCAVLACLPPLYALLTLTSVDDWTGVSFCF
jgi:hypothetical protein